MKETEGGVCAAKGFSASGVHCGIRANHFKKDLALVVSSVRASAAAVYTSNLVQSAPIAVTKENLADGFAQAVICNSGNANTCNDNGVEIARGMCALLREHANIAENDVIVASTGVIGQTLSLEPIRAGMPALTASLASTELGGREAAEAIMTTDTVPKEAAVEFELSGTVCRLGGIAKGSGMIHPDMATLLVFLTTDAAVSPEMLQKALSDKVKGTFNMVSIDGDTSTNDMVSVLANGLAGNPVVAEEGPDFEVFAEALEEVMTKLCRMIARDGEGATKLLTCTVRGAADLATARTAARGVISSNLLKCAMYGSDANWGRVLCALGYSGADIDPQKVDVTFSSSGGAVNVCRMGRGVPFSEELASQVLGAGEIVIDIDLHAGEFTATAWGCDLTREYVNINADYRS